MNQTSTFRRALLWAWGVFVGKPRPPRPAARPPSQPEDPVLDAMVLPLGIVILEEERLRREQEQATSAPPEGDREYDPGIDDPEIHDLLE